MYLVSSLRNKNYLFSNETGAFYVCMCAWLGPTEFLSYLDLKWSRTKIYRNKNSNRKNKNDSILTFNWTFNTTKWSSAANGADAFSSKTYFWKPRKTTNRLSGETDDISLCRYCLRIRMKRLTWEIFFVFFFSLHHYIPIDVRANFLDFCYATFDHFVGICHIENENIEKQRLR